MSVPATLVKQLRDRTNMSFGDCKKALEESSGDLEKAILWLRERGMSRAASKASRVSAEGLVDIATSGDFKSAVVLEVNSETDFVAKGDEFRGFVSNLAKQALASKCSSLDEVKNLKLANGKTAADTLSEMIGRIGEKMEIRRFYHVSTPGALAGYVHGGKIASLAIIEGGSGEKVAAIAKDVAMHVAASSPRFLRPQDVPAHELEQEKELARKKLTEEKKPAEILEKILVGQIQKFYKEVCLIEQPFVKDPNINVAKAVSQVDEALKLTGFVRFGLGEGVEKQEKDFAAEVAATIQNR